MDERIRNIVLGIADVQGEDPNLRPAVALAESAGATLHVVHGFYLPDPAYHPYPEISAFSPEALRQLEEGAQSRLELQLRNVSASARIHARGVPGPAELAVVSVAEEVEADLILVGATHRGRVGRVILGTTAQRIVRGATVPVLVRRREPHGPVRRVLLATDLSEVSARMCGRGLQLARQLEGGAVAESRVLLVLGYDTAVEPPLSRSDPPEIVRAELEGFVKGLPSGAAVPEEKVRTGDPASEIVAEASEWGADLLVVGTHGRSGVSRFLIGSVAESVLSKAACDVLVVPMAAVAAQEDDHPAGA